MLAKIKSFGLNGIIGFGVDIEADISGGSAGIEIVGLPNAAVKESKERVRAAIANSGLAFPASRIMINLAPADLKKEGTLYDLGVALCIMCATRQINSNDLEDAVFLGELSLNGDVRHVNGILPILIAAYQNKCKKVFIPQENVSEAAYIKGLEVYGVSSLKQIVSHFRGISPLTPVPYTDIATKINNKIYSSDFKYITGQYKAKRAMEICATGGHNLLMIGPPGAGKTMLARCLPTIMPDMSADECLESTKIYSVAGMLDPDEGLVCARPFRSPHHTSSRIALTGGGAKANPGEISLAHNGVLFLDELPEYPRATLEILRQPLEDGVVTISRAMKVVEYPASFMLIASMNPCPCGKYGQEDLVCTCTPTMVSKYRSRVSGPLMDRIDLHLEVGAITYDDLKQSNLAEPSIAIKQRVDTARSIQRKRFKELKIHCNAQMKPQEVNQYCEIDDESEALMRMAFEKLRLSARAHNRVLKVSRTIADLENSQSIKINHIAEALSYRSTEGKYSF